MNALHDDFSRELALFRLTEGSSVWKQPGKSESGSNMTN
jgi:hypothetical protein